MSTVAPRIEVTGESCGEDLDAAEREHVGALQEWNGVNAKLAAARRGLREDGSRMDPVEKAATVAELEARSGEVAQGLMDARKRLTAAKVAYVNAQLAGGLVEKFKCRATQTAEVREELRRDLAAFVRKVWAYGAAVQEEKTAARAVIELVAGLVTDGDEKRALVADAAHDLPTHVGEDGRPDRFIERRRGLYGGDGPDDDPNRREFWTALGEGIEGGPNRGRFGRTFAKELNGNGTR